MIIFDSLSQYTPDGTETLVTSSPLQLKAYLRDKRNPQVPFRVLFQCRADEPVEQIRPVGLLVYATGNVLFCVDELGLLCENGQLMQDGPKGTKPILKKLIHQGRHRKVTLVATAQRPIDMALRYRALATEFRVFNTQENLDLTYLRKRMGESAVSQLPNLPKYQFLLWTDQGWAVYSPKLEGVKRNGKDG